MSASMISMVTADVVEISRVQRLDSQLAAKVSTGCPQGESRVKTLKRWQVTVDDAFFLGGIEKG
jgi:hypothetical protein